MAKHAESETTSYHHLTMATSQQLDVWFKTGSNLASCLGGTSALSMGAKKVPSHREQSAQNEQFTFGLPPGLSMAAAQSKSGLEGGDVDLTLPPTDSWQEDTQKLVVSGQATNAGTPGPAPARNQRVRLQATAACLS